MQKISLADRLILAFSRVEPAGLSPWAPGTCGSAVAITLAPFIFLPLPMWARLAVLVTLFIAGSLAAGKAEKILNEQDPGAVVIDEVLGQWVTCLPFLYLSWWELLLAFALFRFFDILKPWPIKLSEGWFPGGVSVMFDDLLAGVYAMALLYGIEFALGRF